MTVGQLRKWLAERPDVSDTSEVRVWAGEYNGASLHSINQLSVYHPGGLQPGESISARSHVWVEIEIE